MSTAANPAPLSPLRGLVPLAHVADVRRSADFYQQIGFEVGNQLMVDNVLQWTWVRSGYAHLMLARSARAMNPDAQDVLFYLYAPDVVAYRNQLQARGITVGPLCHPDHMPQGEFRITDPDGYCLLVGQWDAESINI